MVNFQQHQETSDGFDRRSPENTHTTQYGTSHLLDHQHQQQYSSFDSCSCPGTNCLYPLNTSIHQQNGIVVVDPVTGATTAVDPSRYPLQPGLPPPRRSAQAFSTCTSLLIVLVATCLMLFLAHTFFSILYYGTYDFRRSGNSNSQFEFEKDETAELIETAFTQLTRGQEIRFKQDDVCLEPYGRYIKPLKRDNSSDSLPLKEKCTFKWWLNGVQNDGKGLCLKFAFADDRAFFGEGSSTTKLHLHCFPPEQPNCQLAVLPFRKSSYRFRLAVHQIDSDSGRAYFALHSAASPQMCIGLRPLSSETATSNSTSSLELYIGADHQLMYLDGVDFREALMLQALFDEEEHQFLDFRRAVEAGKEELKILNLPVMQDLVKRAEGAEKERKKKEEVPYSSSSVHTYNVGGRRWHSA